MFRKTDGKQKIVTGVRLSELAGTGYTYLSQFTGCLQCFDTCWLGGRKSIWPVKKWGDGGCGHWLVRMEWRRAGWSVCLPLLIFPCTIKSRSSLLAPAHPGGPGKGAVNDCGCDVVYRENGLIKTPIF